MLKRLQINDAPYTLSWRKIKIHGYKCLCLTPLDGAPVQYLQGLPCLSLIWLTGYSIVSFKAFFVWYIVMPLARVNLFFFFQENILLGKGPCIGMDKPPSTASEVLWPSIL